MADGSHLNAVGGYMGCGILDSIEPIGADGALVWFLSSPNRRAIKLTVV